MQLFLSYVAGEGHDVKHIVLDDEYTVPWATHLVETLIAGQDIEVLDKSGTRHLLPAAWLAGAKLEV